MDPAHLAVARREMNIWLRDRGITHRPIALLDALIGLFRSLESERTHQ